MFVSFGSGSSGNCAYIGTRSQGLLIDAGVAPETVKKLMADNGLDYNSIRGILLTHDHGDHMRYAYKLLRKQTHMMLYTTPKALNGLLRRHSISSRIKDYHHPIYKEHLYRIGDFEVTAFETSHDGTDNMGFFIQFGPHHKFAVVTDTGFVTERADHYMRQARYIMLESNYDAGMLKHGPYTEILKSRISSASGHLDNADAAGYLARIYTPQLTHVFLCHLSNDNNTPELALRPPGEPSPIPGLPWETAAALRNHSARRYSLQPFPATTPLPYTYSGNLRACTKLLGTHVLTFSENIIEPHRKVHMPLYL